MCIHQKWERNINISRISKNPGDFGCYKAFTCNWSLKKNRAGFCSQLRSSRFLEFQWITGVKQSCSPATHSTLTQMHFLFFCLWIFHSCVRRLCFAIEVVSVSWTDHLVLETETIVNDLYSLTGRKWEIVNFAVIYMTMHFSWIFNFSASKLVFTVLYA